VLDSTQSAPASNQSLFANNADKPKGGKTGLIIGLALGAVAIIAIILVVFLVIIPGANKDDKGGKKDSNTSQNGSSNNGSNNGGNNGSNKGGDEDDDDDDEDDDDDDNGGSNNGGSNTNANSIVGKYELYSMIDSEGNEDTTEVAMISALVTMYIEFKEDGTGRYFTEINEEALKQYSDQGATIDIDEEKTEQSFNWKDGKITVGNSEGELEDCDYELSEDGQYVTLSAEGQGIKFKRTK
jgi:hypothetical protein